MMRQYLYIAAWFAALGALPLAHAAETVSPAIVQAIEKLRTDDEKARAKALEELQATLGKQLRELITQDDPESQARLTAILEYNEGVSCWVVEMTSLPAAERDAMLAWGVKPDVLPVVARLYGSNQLRRIEGMRAIGKIKGKEASAILARLLSDRDRLVYLAAMEEVWDREPTDGIVDALWHRAIEAPLTQARPRRAEQGEPIRFRGQVVGNMVVDDMALRRGQDSNVATEVLANLRAPAVSTKIVKLLEALETGKAPEARIAFSSPYTDASRNLNALLEAYRPREAMPYLFRLATGPQGQKNNSQIGELKAFWSSRTGPMAVLLSMTEQNAEDYGLKRQRILNNAWAHETEAAEAEAVKKLQAWWRENEKNFKAEPATAPAK